MTVETTLTRDLFIRLSILRHIQRKTFYFWAIVCAVLTAFALVQGPMLLLYAAWLPFGLYLAAGIFLAVQGSMNQNQPHFLPTRYEFNSSGVSVSTEQGHSQLGWEHFSGWKKMAHCYVLFLTTGPILAIPQKAVAPTQTGKFEGLLNKHLQGQG